MATTTPHAGHFREAVKETLRIVHERPAGLSLGGATKRIAAASGLSADDSLDVFAIMLGLLVEDWVRKEAGAELRPAKRPAKRRKR